MVSRKHWREELEAEGLDPHCVYFLNKYNRAIDYPQALWSGKAKGEETCGEIPAMDFRRL